MPRTTKATEKHVHAEPARKPRKARFKKSTPQEREKWLADYEALLDEVRKLNIPPFDATDLIRKQRNRED